MFLISHHSDGMAAAWHKQAHASLRAPGTAAGAGHPGVPAPVGTGAEVRFRSRVEKTKRLIRGTVVLEL